MTVWNEAPTSNDYTSENFIDPEPENTCGRVPGQLNTDTTLIICTTVKTGTFVRLQFYNTRAMNLMEVEVHGY